MEILFVSHKYPPATGGMEKQSYELIEGMQKHCKVHRLVYDGTGSRIGFFFTLNRKIKQLCRRHPGINIIHYNDGLLAAVSSFHRGYAHLRRTATLHGLDVVFPSRIYHKYILPRFNRFDKLIAVSLCTADRAIALGLHPDKVTVIANGVDTRTDAPAKKVDLREWLGEKGINLGDRRILVLMGRPVLRKGFSWFIRSVLPKLNGRFILLLIGPFHHEPVALERRLSILPAALRTKIMLFLGYPSDEHTLRELLHRRQDAVHLGRLPRTDINMVLSQADAFLMPNISVVGDMEGFGLVCLEAATQGALVFAANVDGIPDAIQHGKNGVLLPSENANAWADSLLELAKTPETLIDKKLAFRQFTIDNYSWEKMVISYHTLFKQL